MLTGNVVLSTAPFLGRAVFDAESIGIIFLNNAENLQNEFEIGSTNMEGKTGKTENSIQNSHYGRGGRLILPGVQ